MHAALPMVLAPRPARLQSRKGPLILHYAGAIGLHEATHVKHWTTNNLPVFGCDGAAKSRRAQADYLYRVGDSSVARWVEGQIGSWC